MRAGRLSTMFMAAAVAAMSVAPTIALAGPQAAERAPAQPAPAPAPTVAAEDEAAHYAAREKAADPAVAEFEGGRGAYIAIGGTTLAVVALVVLLILIL